MRIVGRFYIYLLSNFDGFSEKVAGIEIEQTQIVKQTPTTKKTPTIVSGELDIHCLRVFRQKMKRTLSKP